jgi:hypothetical protein
MKWWIWKDLVGSGRGLILRYYPGIHLEGLRKTTKNSIRMAGLRGRDLDPGPPEYEAGVLMTWPRPSVWWIRKDVEGSGRGLIWGTIPLFAGLWRKPRKSESGYPVSRPRFGPVTSRIRSSSVNRSTMTFYNTNFVGSICFWFAFKSIFRPHILCSVEWLHGLGIIMGQWLKIGHDLKSFPSDVKSIIQHPR